MLVSQRTSYNKKKTLGGDSFLQTTYFAVYPFQIEFHSNADYMTAFYFQKNFQIIGEIDTLIPPSKKGKIYKLDSPKNFIQFRLFTEKNVVYKWSLYKRHDSGAQEFLNSCTINLKQIVLNFVMPKNSQAVRTQESLLDLGFVSKVVRSKFPNQDIILSFVLYISDDLKEIQGDVEKKYFQQPSRFSQMVTLKLGDKVSSQQNVQSEKTFKLQLPTHQNNEELNQTSNQLKSLESISKNSYKAGSAVKQQEKKSNQQQIIDEIEKKAQQEKNDPYYIIFNGKYEKKSQYSQQNAQKIGENEEDSLQNIEFKKADNQNDYGYLKLQSDQGRFKQQNIDKKLELQQLDVIQEERRSARRDKLLKSINPHFQISRVKRKLYGCQQTGEKFDVESADQEKAQKSMTLVQRFYVEVLESSDAKKKLLLLLLIATLCVVLILSGTNINTRKRSRK